MGRMLGEFNEENRQPRRRSVIRIKKSDDLGPDFYDLHVTEIWEHI